MKSFNNNLIMKTTKVVLVAIMAIAFSFSATAQTCSTTLKSKTGTVLSANPSTTKVTATSNQVTVRVKKTGGRAATQVNIYVNGQYQSNKVITFLNGNYSENSYRSKTLTGVQGKEIKVVIVNQSVANRFDYKLKIDGAKASIASTGGPVTGKLMGQTNKTIYTNGSCTPKTRIIVRRTAGKARGNIRVWQKNGNSWNLMNQYNKTIEKAENKKIFVVNSNKELKVELRNVSVGNTISYKMNTTAAN